MPFPMIKDKSPYPIEISPFCAQRVMLEADYFPDLVEEFGLARFWGWRYHWGVTPFKAIPSSMQEIRAWLTLFFTSL
jgi:hypothetical protein